MKNIIVAILVTLVLYLVSIYISRGTVLIPLDYTIWVELILSVFYFLILFWLYPKISRFIHSPPFQNLNSLLTNLAEGFIVVLATIFLTAAIKLPFLWVIVIWVEEVQWFPDAVRRGFVIQAVSGLFFYYFVERNRIRKRLQRERLNAARLEREKFHAELQELKDQANPHFLFDNLEVLTPLITKDPEESVRFVEKLSEVYRSFLASNENELITFKEELETLDAYSYLVNSQSGETIKIHKDSLKDSGNLYLPPGVLFFVIENLVKMENSNAKDKPEIQLSAEDGKLKVKCHKYWKSVFYSEAGTKFEPIKSRYAFFSEELPEVYSENNQLVVELPLLKIKDNESSNY
ncbi:histidine kinase [Salegentibacter sediminis]|uniref:histidine kinase n=1 Tax=Salegentibacter sediminis TaxID=1930251 RepID=UPI0009BE1891|nr:sensor histidine kinase [Salegentibacter sediminis]